MKYAFFMGLISVFAAVGVIEYPGAAVVLAWTSLSFAVVGVGYAGAGARVFGKRGDGSMGAAAKVILLPYLLFTWAVWHLCRLTSREDAFNNIGDDLVIGRRLLPGEVPEGFDHYVDLTSEFEEPKAIREREGYRCMPIMDAGVPTRAELERAVARTAEGRTYIHCAQGHGRTGLFAMALLHQRGQVTSAEEGLRLLRQLRPAVSLNRQQERFITEYMMEGGEGRGSQQA